METAINVAMWMTGVGFVLFVVPLAVLVLFNKSTKELHLAGRVGANMCVLGMLSWIFLGALFG